MSFARAFLLVLLFTGSLSAQGRPQVAFTFDDLPAHGELPPNVTRVDIASTLTAALRAGHLPPVYGFINGANVAGDEELEPALKAWRDGGQMLGNHTGSHPDINDLSAPAFEAEIAANQPLLEKYMPNEDWHWFRYPYLHEGDTLAKRREVRSYLKANNYRVAEVTIDFEDYLWNDPYARCAEQNDQHAIATLHDTYLATAAQYITFFRKLSHRLYGRDVKYVLLLHEGAFDARMMPELIELFKRRGFGFIPLETAEKDPVYRVNPDMADPSGGTLLEQIVARRKMDLPDEPKPYKLLESLCPEVAHSSR